MKALKKIYLLAAILFTANVLMAQSKSSGILDWSITNILVVLAILLIALTFYILLNVTTKLMEMQKMQLFKDMGLEVPEAAPAKPGLKIDILDTIYRKLTNYVPLEKEADVDLGHDYDGIRELDNSLPPWWVYLFYITIAFSAIYLYWYHVSDKGVLIKDEYHYDIAALEQMRADYLATAADAVDETNVTRLMDEVAIAEGLAIYKRNCIACHLESGGGSVGPNLTDEYWIHGGGIKNIFSVIKHGVPEKGMISWKTQLTPKQMQQVASYIMTLEGTKPADAKAPEGELYVASEQKENGDDTESSNNQ